MFCSPMKSAPKFAQLFYRYRLWEIVSLLTRVRRSRFPGGSFASVSYLPTALFTAARSGGLSAHISYITDTDMVCFGTVSRLQRRSRGAFHPIPSTQLLALRKNGKFPKKRYGSGDDLLPLCKQSGSPLCLPTA